jgi:glyoxylase-like metal-dependent hydrolase (beta-lactamase superfamily II)
VYSPHSFTPDLSVHPDVTPFFDRQTNTFSYVVSDPTSSACAVIDSVMDFDYAAGRIRYDGADRIIRHIEGAGLEVAWLIETHVHADHLSAAPYIQKRTGGLLGIGENIMAVQETFGKIFNEGTEFQRDGSQFDRLFHDGDIYEIGSLAVSVLETPGHTPACTTHVVGNAVFVGDTLFLPDGGTARADFPGGDARTLYRSIQRLLALPDEMRIFVCHDYGPNGRKIRCETTVGEQNRKNIQVGVGSSEEAFVAWREARDATLAMPGLIIPALQINMKGGQLPAPQADGRRFLRVPIDSL